MATTKEDIREWIKAGIQAGATYMLVVCDTFNYEKFPVYVSANKNVREVYANQATQKQRVMEVYNLKLDIEDQLNQPIAMNF